MTKAPSALRAFHWKGDRLEMLDQTKLPRQEIWVELRTWEAVRDSIKEMTVRGAPAIGISAAYGMALACLAGADRMTARAGLLAARPTAVNLKWALDRLDKAPWSFKDVQAEAEKIDAEDLAMNLLIGYNGAELVPKAATILTICNTGSLATAGHGTALGIIRSAFEQGKVKHVYACETRPRQQGLKLTAYELKHDGIPFQVIADGAAATLMARGEIDFVVAGADRIAANGDTANKLGTFMLACLAKQFGIPFVIAAPSSTIDPSTLTGADIPIEERASTEITHAGDTALAVDDCPVWNPAFDVTPGSMISAIVTESGVMEPPYGF